MPFDRSNRSPRTGKKPGSEKPKSGRRSRRKLATWKQDEQRKEKEAAERRAAAEHAKLLAQKTRDRLLVNPEKLAPNNSYSPPPFIKNGYYSDIPFSCADCGVDQIWTAAQQKWWYEMAKGAVYSTAKYCRACRRKRKPQ